MARILRLRYSGLPEVTCVNTFLSSMGLTLLEWSLCLGCLLCVHICDKERKFMTTIWLLASRLVFATFLIPVLVFGGHGMPTQLAYHLYFYGYWASFASEAVLSLLVINSLFNLAMEPLDGIKDLGEIVFRWAAGVSVALTIAVMFVPHTTGVTYVTSVLTELQRAQGVLTLSLLLFVLCAIRPLGLTYRSRAFGVILGLAALAAANLISSGWLAHSTQLHSVINMAKSLSTSFALALWTLYFVLPEPERHMVILPTTSPYLRWNRVAEVLGDPPGFVAIAGVPPQMFAPAEIEVMKRASLMMVPPVLPLARLIEESQSQTA